MESKTLCIVGCCRDVEPYIEKVLSNIDTIYSWWKECKVVIFENDSTDNTRKILQNWIESMGGHRQIVTEDGLSTRIQGRVDRLAYIRNRLLFHVPPTFDYMLMMDMDDITEKPIRKESFDSCFGVNDWEVMTSNTDWYYDIWALRVPNIIEFDCWKLYYEIIQQGFSNEDASWKAIEKYKEWMSRVQNILPVYSAFNGAALYKISAIHACCRFSGRTTDGKEICEHVPFQTCLRSHGARIFFNPKFKL